MKKPASTVMNFDDGNNLNTGPYAREWDFFQIRWVGVSRHNGKGNVLLMDGHVESCGYEKYENLCWKVTD